MTTGAMFGVLEGIVAEFDDPRGVGVARSDDGREFPFHCTAVADGSRTIEPGVSVTFEVRAGRLGRWEATAIRPRCTA
jgi:cold shock CspA family protein